MNWQAYTYDKERVLNWWTGRISDQNLSDWTGLSLRNVRACLATEYMKKQISGGGRGSKNSRRISPQARNSIAVIAALRDAGMTIETAISLLSTVPVIASFPTRLIDFTVSPLVHCFENVQPTLLIYDDPEGGWLSEDVVPRHIFDRTAVAVSQISKQVQNIGDFAWYPTEYIEKYGLPDDRRADSGPIYRPEFDPMGVYEFGNDMADVIDRYESRVYVVDGRWVYARHSDVDPYSYYLNLFLRTRGLTEEKLDDPSYSFSLIAEIDSNGIARSTRSDDIPEAMEQRIFQQYQTKLDINTSLAVRKMKRRAYNTLSGADRGGENG